MKTKFSMKFRIVGLFLISSILVYSQHDCHNPMALKQDLQQVLDSSANALGIQGLSAAISLPNGRVLSIVSGYSYDDVEITPETLYGAGSIVKTFVAAAIMQLSEERKLSITDPINNYFSDHTNINGDVTIKQLLNHTSGIFNYTENDTFFTKVFGDPSKVWQPEEILTYVNEPLFDPGTDWRYSNTDYVVLGIIIQNITGNSLADELDRRFIKPLHLKSTVLYPDKPYLGELSHVYFDVLDYTALAGPSLFSCAWAAGGLISIPEDLVKWAKALYKGKAIRHSSVHKMIRETSEFNPEYGLGTVLLDVDGQTTYGHNGDILYNSYVNYFPHDRISIAVMGNKAGTPVESVMLSLYEVYKNSKLHPQHPQNHHAEVSCYPNPFVEKITFKYELQTENNVILKISNIYGRAVTQISKVNEQAGIHTITWDGKDAQGKSVHKGPYYYTLIAGDKITSGIIMKK